MFFRIKEKTWKERGFGISMKHLTITVPCFNSEDYLERCLDSLVIGGEQVEIIVVNDGSTDRTGEIAERYARQYPDIVTVVHKENGGLVSAWQAGVKASSGAYLGFVDSDDWVEPDMLVHMAACLSGGGAEINLLPILS